MVQQLHSDVKRKANPAKVRNNCHIGIPSVFCLEAGIAMGAACFVAVALYSTEVDTSV